MGKSSSAVLVDPKAKCCRDRPRCKRCPVVCKKLMKQGLAERTPEGRYLVAAGVKKKQLKAARA